MTYRAFRNVPLDVSYSKKNNTHYLKQQSARHVRKTLRPVIVLSGWSNDSYAQQILETTVGGLCNVIAASGRTVYSPFTGANFGQAATTFPVTNGTGLTAVDDVLLAAASDGHDTSVVDIHATSMGGMNAMNWAWRNPDRIGAIYMWCPLSNFMDTYDMPFVQENAPLPLITSIHGAFGVTNRSETAAASAPYDPAKNLDALRVFGERIKVSLASGDEVIPFDSAIAFYNSIGATVTTTPGSHFFPLSQSQFSEFDSIEWFDAHT